MDPEGKRLPIKIDTTSNGEFVPVPLSARNRLGNRLAHEAATERAKRLGLSRRQFLISASGAASTLLAFNDANAMSGGYFDVPPAAAMDQQLAQATVGAKREFIFDVQGHFVDPSGAWTKKASPSAFNWANTSCTKTPHLDCLGPDEFVKDVFRDSPRIRSRSPSRRPTPCARSSTRWASACSCMAACSPMSRAISIAWRS